MATVAQRTVLPEHGSVYGVLARLLTEEHVSLETAAGHVNLPPSVQTSLREIVAALQAGKAVSFETVRTLLTTQEAADYLGVSRPTLIKLLEQGEIEYERPGRHRRVPLGGVLKYLERTAQNRREALDEMLADSGEIPDAIATKPYIPRQR